MNYESSIQKENKSKQNRGFLAHHNGLIKRINVTFWSILIMNWILIGIGVIMFGAALYGALGLRRIDVAALLSVTGFGDIAAVFKYSINRVQRSLGDQVQVQTACYGYEKQIMKLVEHFDSNGNIAQVKAMNEEIRKATLFSMELIQNFTEIGKPLRKEPWISRFPIRYERLNFPSEVYVGEKITASGAFRNVGDKPINLTSIVIAVRPPFGTPSGGPFRFDFHIDPARTLKPGESYTITKTKCIEDSARDEGTKVKIPEKYLGEDWVAFMTCQTEDGHWHDDPNKTWFAVLKRGATAKVN